MEMIVNLLASIIFICACFYGYLTYQVWRSKDHELKRFQKSLILDGWWIFNPSYVKAENKHLITKGRALFSVMLISGIAIMVIASSSTKI